MIDSLPSREEYRQIELLRARMDGMRFAFEALASTHAHESPENYNAALERISEEMTNCKKSIDVIVWGC